MSKHPRIALIHDYLREFGGAERVLAALHYMYPEAPIYVGFVDEAAMGSHWPQFANWDLRQTWLARLPLIKKLYSPLRVLAPRAFKSLDLSQFDVVISSSNAYFAKAVQVPHGTHICYCHTPPRSLYGYSTMSDWRKNPITRIGGTLLNHYTRVVDYNVAQNVDVFIANSAETQRRITKFYRRESVVINPPVNLPAKPPAKQQPRDYYLYVNRLALAKHPEIAVQASTELDLPLKVVGSGKMLPDLQAQAGPTIEFLGSVSDERLSELYAGAKALLYPVEDEDFGIVPVEAMGHGVPVLAHKSGGPRETILDGETGLFFEDLTVEGLKQAIQQAQKVSFNHKKIYQHSQSYSAEAFAQKISQLVKQHS